MSGLMSNVVGEGVSEAVVYEGEEWGNIKVWVVE
jgi:hypothetical protein